MTSEQADRMMLGWTREQLAQMSGVSLASVYLFERMGTAGSNEDVRIRNALAQAKADFARSNARPAANDRGVPQNSQHTIDWSLRRRRDQG